MGFPLLHKLLIGSVRLTLQHVLFTVTSRSNLPQGRKNDLIAEIEQLAIKNADAHAEISRFQLEHEAVYRRADLHAE